MRTVVKFHVSVRFVRRNLKYSAQRKSALSGLVAASPGLTIAAAWHFLSGPFCSFFCLFPAFLRVAQTNSIVIVDVSI